MRSLLFTLVVSIFLISCTPKDNSSYIVKYGNKEIQSAEFINKMMVLGFIKYGTPFYTQIYDPVFFENLRSETIEHIISTLFYGSLSQKHQIKITEAELDQWIKERTPDLNKEDLVYTLKANNLSYASWKALFREQFIQKKVLDILIKEPDNKEIKETSAKKSNDDALYMAVIHFEDGLQAKEAYKRIAKNRVKFDDVLKQESNTSAYSWVKTADLPFYSKIRNLSRSRVSKPIETPWGHLLVRIQKRGKFPTQISVASSQVPLPIKPLLEDFKKDSKLQINTELLYSLKIKK